MDKYVGTSKFALPTCVSYMQNTKRCKFTGRDSPGGDCEYHIETGSRFSGIRCKGADWVYDRSGRAR